MRLRATRQPGHGASLLPKGALRPEEGGGRQWPEDGASETNSTRDEQRDKVETRTREDRATSNERLLKDHRVERPAKEQRTRDDDPAALDEATTSQPTAPPTAETLPEPRAGATVWENRSGVEGSGYYEM